MIVSEEVKWLSKEPNTVARWFSAYVINGYKFIVEGCERKNKTLESNDYFIYC